MVLATLVLSALLLLPPMWLSVPLALMFLVAGGWENARLAGLSGAAARVVWIVILCGAGAGLVRVVHVPAAVPLILGLAVAGWLLLALWLRFPDLGRAGQNHFQPVKLLVVGAILLAAFISIAWMHAISPWLVVHLIRSLLPPTSGRILPAIVSVAPSWPPSSVPARPGRAQSAA